jgi:hypothetical protein
MEIGSVDGFSHKDATLRKDSAGTLFSRGNIIPVCFVVGNISGGSAAVTAWENPP